MAAHDILTSPTLVVAGQTGIQLEVYPWKKELLKTY